jgi:hypothetical protein
MDNYYELIYFNICSNSYFSNKIFLFTIFPDTYAFDSPCSFTFTPLVNAQTPRKNPTLNIIYNAYQGY